MAPPYEEIRTTIDTIYTGERALSEDERKRLEAYVQGLLGKRVDWQGWLAQINPEEAIGEDFNRDDYQGNYSAYVLMEDPNAAAGPTTGNVLLVLGVPRSQLEQFRLWNEPNQDPRSREKIRIHGIISHIDTSTADFLVTATSVLPED